jgi:D-serine deaminase-like pyridoxal phosphate-dependent protein
MLDTAPLLDQARDRAMREYGAAVGQRREDLVTPALVLDVDAAQRNIDRMASELRAIGGATIRPHYKTHKSPDLARRQVQAGANGLSMATVWEAAVLAAAGLDDLFVVNTVSHPEKIRLLAELARDHRILVAVDEAANAEAHSAAAVAAGSTLGVFVEVDTGMNRCGVDTAEDALAVARQVAALPGLRFEGITGYEGHCTLTPEADLRHQRQQAAMKMFTGAAGRTDGARNAVAGGQRHSVPHPFGRRHCHLALDSRLPRNYRDSGWLVRSHGQLPWPDGGWLRTLAVPPGVRDQPAERPGHRRRRQQVGR